MRRLISFSSILVLNVVNHITDLCIACNGETLFIAWYVDDLVISRSNIDLILGLEIQLVDRFEMTNIDLLHFFLVIHVLQMDDSVFISQLELCVEYSIKV
jgi:hypothetical protein